MRDAEYRDDDIASYGVAAQPAAAARVARELRLIRIGTGVALLGVVAAVLAVVTYPDAFDIGGRGWAVLELILAGLLLLGCIAQYLAWSRAGQAWAGLRTVNLASLSRWSWGVQLASYVVTLLALWACIAGIVAAGWWATASLLLMLALLCMLVALVLAAVQYVRPSGPPGAVPAQMRRIVDRENSSGRG